MLSAAYAEHMRASSAEGFSSPLEGGAKHDDEDLERIGLTNFDFHATSRIAGGIEGVRSELRYLGPVQLKKKAFGYTLVEPRGGSLVVRQEGVFRTNCLDW